MDIKKFAQDTNLCIAIQCFLKVVRSKYAFIGGTAGWKFISEFRWTNPEKRVSFAIQNEPNESMEPEITIRPESPREFSAVYDLVRVAFLSAKISAGDEQDYVSCLRQSANYIPELSLVAYCGDQLVGHLMMSKSFIRPDRVCVPRLEPFRLLLLAPLAVELRHRKQGIGAQLVQDAFQRAAQLGWSAVAVVGDPAYYERMGFVPAARYGIYAAGDRQMYEPYLLVKELTPGVLDSVSGTIDL